MLYVHTSLPSCMIIALAAMWVSITTGAMLPSIDPQGSCLSDKPWTVVSSQEHDTNVGTSSTLISGDVSFTSRSVEARRMRVNLINKHNGGSLYAYVVDYDAFGAHMALLSSGQWFYPRPTASTVPQSLGTDISWPLAPTGDNRTITIPGTFISGRISISEGELNFSTVMTAAGARLVEPAFLDLSDSNASQVWSVIELTLWDSEIFADITYVDFVSLQLALEVQDNANGSWMVSGINATATRTMCELLQGYAREEGQPWDKLCLYDTNGRLIRIVAPHKYMNMDGQAFAEYYQSYVHDVYRHFSGNITLQVTDSEHVPTSVSCRVDRDRLSCAGANRVFEMPTTEQILGCNGTLAAATSDNEVVALVVPRLCAAFQRSTLLLDGGDQQPGPPTTMFYQSSPTNRYAQLVHHLAPDGIGYAFPFDDVHWKDARDQSGLLHRSNATSISITVGDDS